MMRLLLMLGALLALAGAAQAEPRLERVVIVMRHGVRPPTKPNSELAQYAAQPWPDWPVAPGELTPHGGEGVRLMGESLRDAYVALRLLPARGCAPAGEVEVWADGADQRTRKTGEIVAGALEPSCGLAAPSAPPSPRDPIFAGSDAGACKLDPANARKTMAAAAAEAQARQAPQLRAATARLQSILAPAGCGAAGPVCLVQGAPGGAAATPVPFPPAAALAEDIYLEYADAKPMSDVGWGRASRADIDAVMRVHEAAFDGIRRDLYLDARRGAPMARLALAALAGSPLGGGPKGGPDLKLLALAGHDTNLLWMEALFGLDWTLPGQPEATAPATALALELWSDGARRFVRPVLYYETLDQLRTLRPAKAERLPLRFKDCASGPSGGCPLKALTERVTALLPPGCGEMAVAAPVATPRS